MKSKLSAWKYVKNNKRTVAVLVTALALSCVAMYAIYVLLITTTDSLRPIMLELPKKVSYASLTGKAYGLDAASFEDNEAYSKAYDEAQEELIRKLKEVPGIDDAIYTQIQGSTYQAVMGGYSFEMPLLEVDQIQGFLDHVGAELVDGEMPKEPGDVLVDETILKNQEMILGDWYYKEWFGETFRISGVIRSKSMACVGVPHGFNNRGWYIVVYNDETTMDLSKILTELGIQLGDGDEIIDSKAYLASYKKDVEGTIDMVLSTIFTIVMTFLAILVLVAYTSFMRNRMNEYCLYASIGYGRGEIYGMILREMILLFGLGLGTGMLLSLVTAAILNALIIEPKGLVGYVFYGRQVLNIVSTYVFLMGILQLPILMNLRRIRTIDAIED